MNELLASLRDALNPRESPSPSAWAQPAAPKRAALAGPAVTRPVGQPVEVAGLQLSTSGDDQGPPNANVIAIDRVESLERGDDLAVSHVLAMGLAGR